MYDQIGSTMTGCPLGLEQSNLTSDRSAVILKPLVLGLGRGDVVDDQQLGAGRAVGHDPPCAQQRRAGGY